MWYKAAVGVMLPVGWEDFMISRSLETLNPSGFVEAAVVNADVKALVSDPLIAKMLSRVRFPLYPIVSNRLPVSLNI